MLKFASMAVQTFHNANTTDCEGHEQTIWSDAYAVEGISTCQCSLLASLPSSIEFASRRPLWGTLLQAVITNAPYCSNSGQLQAHNMQMLWSWGCMHNAEAIEKLKIPDNQN